MRLRRFSSLSLPIESRAAIFISLWGKFWTRRGRARVRRSFFLSFRPSGECRQKFTDHRYLCPHKREFIGNSLGSNHAAVLQGETLPLFLALLKVSLGLIDVMKRIAHVYTPTLLTRRFPRSCYHFVGFGPKQVAPTWARTCSYVCC